MITLFGTVIFGAGSGLLTKVITERLVYNKKDKLHIKITLLGIVFMLIGQALRYTNSGADNEI